MDNKEIEYTQIEDDSDFVPPPLPGENTNNSVSARHSDNSAFVPPPLHQENTNAASPVFQDDAADFTPPAIKPDRTNKTKNKTTAFLYLLCIVLILGIALTVVFLIFHDSSTKNTVVDMGSIGNKITVDGKTAYVAGENKILVPYDVTGSFDHCNQIAGGKVLKGCENPRLPTVETDDLPKKAVEDIISFYKTCDGFWTSFKAAHATIEVVGSEPESVHYAGVMTDYFDVGGDGVAKLAYGYCLKPTDDTALLGLLVLYDVTKQFEFTDIEDVYVSLVDNKSAINDDSDKTNNKSEFSIKQDLFNNIGVTFAEMEQKFGGATSSGNYEGAELFRFPGVDDVEFCFDYYETDQAKKICLGFHSKSNYLFNNYAGKHYDEIAELEGVEHFNISNGAEDYPFPSGIFSYTDDYGRIYKVFFEPYTMENGSIKTKTVIDDQQIFDVSFVGQF